MRRVQDEEQQVYTRFRAAWAGRVRALVTDELIAEHRASPRGPHSDQLARVLRYLGSAPIAGKEIVLEVEPWREYRIGLLTDVPGRPAVPLEGDYETYDAVLHAIFVRRVEQLRREGDAGG